MLHSDCEIQICKLTNSVYMIGRLSDQLMFIYIYHFNIICLYMFMSFVLIK